MFEAFFGFARTPFVRNMPEAELFQTPQLDELCSRLNYTARNNLFAVVTGDVGTGKTTGIRKFTASLSAEKYAVFYISDSALTPRNFYFEVLTQLGTRPHFFRGRCQTAADAFAGGSERTSQKAAGHYCG